MSDDPAGREDYINWNKTMKTIPLEDVMNEEDFREKRIAHCAQCIRNWLADDKDERSAEAVLTDAEDDFNHNTHDRYFDLDDARYPIVNDLLFGADVLAALAPHRIGYLVVCLEDGEPVKEKTIYPNKSTFYAVPPAHQ